MLVNSISMVNTGVMDNNSGRTNFKGLSSKIFHKIGRNHNPLYRYWVEAAIKKNRKDLKKNPFVFLTYEKRNGSSQLILKVMKKIKNFPSQGKALIKGAKIKLSGITEPSVNGSKVNLSGVYVYTGKAKPSDIKTIQMDLKTPEMAQNVKDALYVEWGFPYDPIMPTLAKAIELSQKRS